MTSFSFLHSFDVLFHSTHAFSYSERLSLSHKLRIWIFWCYFWCSSTYATLSFRRWNRQLKIFELKVSLDVNSIPKRQPIESHWTVRLNDEKKQQKLCKFWNAKHFHGQSSYDENRFFIVFGLLTFGKVFPISLSLFIFLYQIQRTNANASEWTTIHRKRNIKCLFSFGFFLFCQHIQSERDVKKQIDVTDAKCMHRNAHRHIQSGTKRAAEHHAEWRRRWSDEEWDSKYIWI